MAKQKITEHHDTSKAKTPRKSAKLNFETLGMQGHMAELDEMLAKMPVKRQSTAELLDTLCKALATTEAYGTFIHNFLYPEGRQAPQSEVLPADPNNKLLFIIGRVNSLGATLQSAAGLLGAN